MSQRTLGHEAHTKSVGFAPANPYGVHMKVSFIDIPRRSRLQLSPVVALVQRPTKLPQIRAYLGKPRADCKGVRLDEASQCNAVHWS